MDRVKSPPLSFGDSTGILVLALSVFLAVVNSMFFAVAVRLPVPAISKSGLFLNVIAAAVGWIAFVKGTRPRLPHQLAAIVLLSLVNYHLLSNLWAVIAFGL